MADLANIVAQSVSAALDKFAAAKLCADEIAVTLVALGDPPASAQHRGDAPIYPVSVVKFFYLVAAHQQMEDGSSPTRRN